MDESKRNLIVGIFVVLAAVGLGWMVVQFGDLPTLVSRYNSHKITIFFPEAPGIRENTSVQFRGFHVGKVVMVSPPRLLPELHNPTMKDYQIEVIIAISNDYEIPDNIVPKVYRRGLGGNFIDLTLTGPPSSRMIEEGDKFRGILSEASEFISEDTQRKLDKLISSLTELSDQIRSQMTPLTPEEVDAGKAHANVTTAVMRLDKTLKDLDLYLADEENRQNFKKGMEGFAQISVTLRHTLQQVEDISREAKTMIGKTSRTMEGIGRFADNADKTFQQTAAQIQTTTDKLAKTLDILGEILMKVNTGKGTMGHTINDPRLYETLTDAMEHIDQMIAEMRRLIAEWKANGVRMKLK